MSQTLNIYRDANAQKLLGGQACSQVCDKMTSIGLLWVVAELGGASAVPWFLACAGLPHILLSPVGAKAIARFGALRLVVYTDLLRSILYFLAAGLFLAKVVAPSLPLFFGLVVLTNVAAAFFNPSIFTLPTKMAEGPDLLALNGALNSCLSLSNVVGPLAAIGLYAKGGLGLLFSITALAYLVAAIFGARIRLRSTTTQVELAPKIGDVISSAGSVLLTMLGLFLGMNLLLSPLQIAMPLYAKDIYQGSIHSLAILELSLGAGMIAGSLFLSLRSLPGARLMQVSLALIGAALLYLAFALSGSTLAGAAFCFALGAGIGLANVLILSEFQERPAPESVPTLMVLINAISVASVPFSMVASGLILEHISVQQLTKGAAAALILLTVFSYFMLNAKKEVPRAN